AESNGVNGAPIRQQGEPVWQQGEPIRQQGKPIRQQGVPIRQQGAPIRQQGAPIRHQGEPIRHQGEPIRQQGVPIRQQGVPIRQQGAPIRQQGALIRFLTPLHFILGFHAPFCFHPTGRWVIHPPQRSPSLNPKKGTRIMAQWQNIFERGQDTLAVWQQHSPTFTLRGLTLAQHQADVTALTPTAQALTEAETDVDGARSARDAALAPLQDLAVRLPRKLDGDLSPDDPFHDDLEAIRRFPLDSIQNTVRRSQSVLALWKKLDARNAAATPPVPALTVGGEGRATFQARLDALPALLQKIADQESRLTTVRGTLRTLSTKVDKNNKRWLAAWKGEFPAGTPAGDAISQIKTESGGSQNPPTTPDAAEIGSVQVSPDRSVTLRGLSADGASSFKLQVSRNGDTSAFDDVADNVTGPDYTLGQLTPGPHIVRAAGRNAQGLGPWSAAVSFVVG
ncbi:MAG: hypothetical protein ACOYMN_18365, partial [Roseimicrobium sp.]